MAEVDPDQARQAAEDILARPEFRPESRSLLERFLDWLGRQLPDIDPDRRPVPAGSGSGRGGAGLVTWLLIVAAAALLVWLALRVTRTRRRERARREPSDVTEALLDTDATPATLDGLAARFEAEGRWREAVLMRYRGAVGRLGDAGLVALVPGRTTGELRAEAKVALGSGAAPFDELTDSVEAGWYAGRALDDADAARARELAASVAALADAHIPAGTGP